MVKIEVGIMKTSAAITLIICGTVALIIPWMCGMYHAHVLSDISDECNPGRNTFFNIIPFTQITYAIPLGLGNAMTGVFMIGVALIGIRKTI